MLLPHDSILAEVDKHIAAGFVAIKPILTSSNQSNTLNNNASTTTISTPDQVHLSSEDTGAVILKPTEPLQNKEKRSCLAALKMSLHNSGVAPNPIKETKDTSQRALIVKCHTKQDVLQVEEKLAKNKDIKNLATIEKRGPRTAKFFIKKISPTTSKIMLYRHP